MQKSGFGCTKLPEAGSIRRADPQLVRDLVREAGLLPFYATPIEGFSLRALCAPAVFDVNDKTTNPWYWREQILAEDIVYGQFFNGKLGFVRRDVFPLVMALKRGRRDARSMHEDGLISDRAAELDRTLPKGEVMDVDALRDMLPDDFKGLSGALTQLQHAGLWCVLDFQCRRNRRGEPYGWPLCVFGRPEEHGVVRLEDVPQGADGEREALEKLVGLVRRIAPKADPDSVLRMLALKPRAAGRKRRASDGPRSMPAGKSARTAKKDAEDAIMADAFRRHAVEGMVLGE